MKEHEINALLDFYNNNTSDIDAAYSEYCLDNQIGGPGLDAMPESDAIFFEFLQNYIDGQN